MPGWTTLRILGHCGSRNNALRQARRRLTIARELISDFQHQQMLGLLRAGDLREEVWLSRHAKELDRQIYEQTGSALANSCVAEIIRDFTGTTMPIESADSDAPSPGGPIRAARGIATTSATQRRKPSTIWRDQKRRLRPRELPLPPSLLLAQGRQTRLGPATRHPTLEHAEPSSQLC